MVNHYTYLCHHIQTITNDITLIRLSPQSTGLEYIPGQYVEAIFDGIVLPLSIANVPHPNGELEFHLRHNEKHPIAQKFLSTLIKDKTVSLRGPLGNCTLARAANAKKIVFIAGGTGFTPIKALLETALFYEPSNRAIELYWGICHPQDAYCLSLLQQWQKQFSFFTYELVLSDPNQDPAWQGPTGFVHEHVAAHYPLFEGEVVFASGPYPMIKAALALFGQQSLTTSQFISDMV